MINDPTQEPRYLQALRQLAARRTRVLISAPAFDWWLLASAVQLACRHPEFTGPTRKAAERLARYIFAQIAPDGPISELAAMGWQSEHDQEWGK